MTYNITREQKKESFWNDLNKEKGDIDMTGRIAVETLTLSEISELFRQSFEISFPKSKGSIDNTMKRFQEPK